MKILFLSHYFPPEVNAPATRTFEHCAHWVKAGHQVTVVTSNPNHPHGQLYPGFANRWWHEEQVNGIRVIRIWTLLSANKGFGLRTLNYLWFMFACVLMCWRFGRYDAVISTSPQFFNGLAGYCVSRLKRIPWVLEIRDLWPESIVAVGAMKEGVVTNLLYKLEGFCYRHCDLLVTVTDAFREYMLAKGISSDKILVIKNGVDLSLFALDAEASDRATAERLSALQLDAKFVAAYVGTHGMAHHLDTLLDAAFQLRHRSDIHFLMAGDGAERERLEQRARQMNLTNVTLLGQLPKSSMPTLWQCVDVSLILLRKSDTFKSVIPSKIFESLAMNKPIILGVEGESAELVSSSGCGICMPPEDALFLAETVSRLADDSVFYDSLACGGNAFVTQHFDRDVLAARFVREIERRFSTRQVEAHIKAEGQ